MIYANTIIALAFLILLIEYLRGLSSEVHLFYTVTITTKSPGAGASSLAGVGSGKRDIVIF